MPRTVHVRTSGAAAHGAASQPWDTRAQRKRRRAQILSLDADHRARRLLGARACRRRRQTLRRQTRAPQSLINVHAEILTHREIRTHTELDTRTRTRTCARARRNVQAVARRQPDRGQRERTALVLAGGGARGAYEVGVLSALAPALTEDGARPDIIVGTSIGALNGAFLAARGDEPFEQAVAAGLEMWRSLSWGDAFRPLVSPWELGRLLTGAAMVVGLPGADLPGLLDSSPLRRTLERLVSFDRIASNVSDGTLTAAAVVATAYATTHSVVFHHGGPALGADLSRAIDYAPTQLRPGHVLASAAIPGAFPAVEIAQPATAAGWYGDGGVRLNAPLKPALALGAERVIVIGLNSSAVPTKASTRPDAVDGLAQLLQVVLGDQLAADVATLATVNETLASVNAPAKTPVKAPAKTPVKAPVEAPVSKTPATAGQARSGRSRRRIPYIFVAPRDRFVFGRIARRIYKRHYAGVRGAVRDSNLALLGRVLDADRSAIHGELLSYLFLANEFIEELIALGRSDAKRWLEADHDAGIWHVGQLPDALTDPAPADGA